MPLLQQNSKYNCLLATFMALVGMFILYALVNERRVDRISVERHIVLHVVDGKDQKGESTPTDSALKTRDANSQSQPGIGMCDYVAHNSVIRQMQAISCGKCPATSTVEMGRPGPYDSMVTRNVQVLFDLKEEERRNLHRADVRTRLTFNPLSNYVDLRRLDDDE